MILKQVGDLGFASELGNYAEYSGAPKEDEVLQYARVVIDVSNFCSCFIFALPKNLQTECCCSSFFEESNTICIPITITIS